MFQIKVSKEIRNLRELEGLSQKQLAAKLGVTQSDISQIESGNQNLSCKTIEMVFLKMGKGVEITLSDKK